MAPRFWHLALTLISVTSFAQEQPPAKKVPANANAHSKATTLTHPSAKIPIAEPPPAAKPVMGTSTTPTTGAAAPSTVADAAPLLSWQDAINLTRNNNADLGAAKATVDQYDANVKVQWSNYLPTISASATVQKSNTLDAADPDSDTAKLNLTQNLFNGFGDQARIEQARSQRDAAKASYDLTAAQVSAQLKTAYQNLVISERNVKLSDDIITRRQTNLDIVTLRFEGGRENKGSVLLSNANLQQAKLDRLQAANNVEASRLQLAKVIGEEKLPYADVSSVVPVNVPPLQVDFEQLATNAPELRNSVATTRAAEEGVRVARASFFPTLNLTASAGRFDTQFFPQNDQGVVALGLSIPLFEGGRTLYGLRAAQAVANNAESAKQSTLRTKIVGIRTAYNTYIEAVQQELVAQSFVTAAETRAEIARAQYNTGLISFQDWDQIETDLVTRQRAALTSQQTRVSAEASYEQSYGEGLFK